MSDFRKLNLSAKIINALEKKGYTHPTPIQTQAIPHLLEGRDLLGIAQTGTGKTAAFALPILDNLIKSNHTVRSNGVRSLILTPTRELALQISDNISRYGHDLPLRHFVVFGGVNINGQIRSMKRGVDTLVATPGRLLDLMNQGHVRFAQLETFVLDEADRMLDMGFIHDVKKVIAKLPPERQTLLFSATMPSDIARLAESILNNPIKVEVTPQSTTVEKIDQRVNKVDKSNKLPLLKEILQQEGAKSVLVFSKTKHGANRIVKYLTEQSIGAAAIHGNKSQSAREKALDEFRKGRNKVLVATDIAARGIDVPDITHVVNFDIPQDPESYVHRIGRTARAGKSGQAISFCDPSERLLLKAVEKAIKFRIPVDHSHSFDGVKPNDSLKNYTEIREGGFGNDGRRPKNSSPRFNSQRGSKPSSSKFTQDRRSKAKPEGSSEGGNKREGAELSKESKERKFSPNAKAKPFGKRFAQSRLNPKNPRKPKY